MRGKRLTTLVARSFWTLFAALALLSCIYGIVPFILANAIGIGLLGLLVLPRVTRRVGAEPMIGLDIAVFFVLGLAFVLTAHTPYDAVYALNFLPFLLAAPVYAAGRSLAGPRAATNIVWLSLAGALVALISGLVARYGFAQPRAAGFHTGALIYARMAVLLGFLAGAGLVVGPPRWRALFALGPVFGTAAIILAEARGVLLALPVLTLFLLAYAVSHYRNRRHFWTAAGLISAMLVAMALMFLVLNSSRLGTLFSALAYVRAGDYGALDISIRARIELYQVAWTLYWQAPLLGIGWAHLASGAETLLKPATLNYLGLVQFHNDFVNLAVAAGVLGIASYLAAYAGPVLSLLSGPKDSLRPARIYGVATVTGLYFISGLTDITFGYDLPMTAFVLINAVILSTFRDEATPLSS